MGLPLRRTLRGQCCREAFQQQLWADYMLREKMSSEISLKRATQRMLNRAATAG